MTEAMQGIRMTNACGRQPPIDVPSHPPPRQVLTLTPLTKRAEPESTDLKAECVQRRAVRRHSVVPNVSADDAAQPRALLAERAMHALSQFGLDLVQLCLQSLAVRVPPHREPS